MLGDLQLEPAKALPCTCCVLGRVGDFRYLHSDPSGFGGGIAGGEGWV